MILLVVRAFGTVKNLEKRLNELKIKRRIGTIPTTALLKSAGILRKVLEIRRDLLSLRFQWIPPVRIRWTQIFSGLFELRWPSTSYLSIKRLHTTGCAPYSMGYGEIVGMMCLVGLVVIGFGFRYLTPFVFFYLIWFLSVFFVFEGYKRISEGRKKSD